MRKLLLILIGLFSMTVSAQTKEKVVSQTTKDTLTEKVTELEEVIVGKGVIDLAKDRKTPIAVSTIKAAEIQAKVGTADVTQALVNTPSVYVAGWR